MQQSKNIQKVIEILDDEVLGRTKEALEKTHKDYKMTWVYKTKAGEIFPSSSMSNEGNELEDIYSIKGRVYEIMNITESENVVMVELIESYPDPETQKVYRTPLVLVLEFEDGKIKTGRHYCDPTLSHAFLTKEQTDPVFGDRKPMFIIKE